MVHYVLVCPDKQCHSVNIVNKRTKTVKCPSCGSQKKFKKYKVSYKAENREQAVKARTKLLIKINDDDINFEKLEKDGLLEDVDRVFKTREEVEEINVESEVIEAIESQDSPKKADVIDYINSKDDMEIDKEEIYETIESLLSNGEISKIKDELNTF